MPATLWTHSLEPQRRMLLSLVAELLRLETQLRRQMLPTSLNELNARLLLISRVMPGGLRREFSTAILDQVQDLSLRIHDHNLQSLRAQLVAPPSVPDATGTSVV